MLRHFRLRSTSVKNPAPVIRGILENKPVDVDQGRQTTPSYVQYFPTISNSSRKVASQF
jgi:hypothetical protein